MYQSGGYNLAVVILVGFLAAALSAGADPAGGRTAIAWNAYDNVDRLTPAFGRFVEAGDWVLIIEGNGGKPVDPARAIDKYHRASKELERHGLHYGIYTSDLDNVRALASGLKSEPGIEFIGYGYEPNYAKEFPKGENGGWVFETAVGHVREAAGLAHAAGKKLMVIPTGRPLLEREVTKYGWRYPDFLNVAGADFMLIQTQTFVYQNDFPDAMKVLDDQIGMDTALRDRIVLQVTIEPERVANRNGVSPGRGWDAALEARLRGYRTMSLWHAYRDLDSAYEFLRLAGRDGPRAVPTFECLGLYWSPPGGSAGATCEVRFRAAGADEWREGLPLWFDRRVGEYRGSIVGLTPATAYAVRLRISGTKVSATLAATTWSEVFPVAATVYAPAGVSHNRLHLTQAGTATGYVLVCPPPGGATIDVEGQDDYCVSVEAPFVVVRGLVLKGARRHVIRLDEGVHDVVIEECDLSEWGRIAADGFGTEHDAGIYGSHPDVIRIVIQRNRIHDPNANANDWSQKRVITHESYHPVGPQAVVFYDNQGNHVIRYNEVTSGEKHRWNDGMGGAENFSARGFPGADSDVYGNIVTNVCDDALEIEGSGRNIRVWGNYMDMTYTGVATAACSLGPLYVFRNVMNRSREFSFQDTDKDGRGWFGKLGDEGVFAHGRRCFFHNTLLQPRAPGKKDPLGAWGGPSPCGDNEPMSETMSLDNIWHTCRAGRYFCEDGHRNTTNVFDYDLYNGRFKLYAGAEPHGIVGEPVYLSGHGDEAGGSGRYQLAPGSPGLDAGIRLPNFNDGFAGTAPDMGACEAGTPPMQFGVDACRR